jgi:pyrroline-5-carboxylate reductase
MSLAMSLAVNLAQINNLTLIGAGKMGMALARGWIKTGLRPNSLTLVDNNPHESVIAFAKKHNIKIASEISKADIEILVLAVKPQIITSLFSSIKGKISKDSLVLSIIAGFDLATLSNGLKTNNIVRTMPNTPAQIGKGITGAVAGSAIDEKEREMTNALLKASGKVEWFEDENDLEALTVVSGSGPAYVFLLVEALAAAGVEQGLDEKKAMALARQTIIGAASLMEVDPTQAAILRQNVTSKGGVTEAALSVLMADDDGLGQLMSRALNAARKRDKELGS